MRKIYVFLTGLLFAGLLSIGIWALCRAGEYDRLSEAFPCRDSLLSLNTELNGFYKFTGFSKDDEVQLLIPVQNDAANGGATLPPEPSEQPVPEAPTQTEATTETEAPSQTEATAETEAPTEPVQEPNVETLGQMLLIGDRAVELPRTNYEVIHEYALTVSKLAQALGDIRTYSILVPNSAEFYTPKDYHTGDYSQKNMIDYAYLTMGETVHTVDAYSQLEEHKDEYIYFRTDHHWTQLGAYYAYSALCEELGYVRQPLHNFEKGEYESFLGSMYSFLSGYPQRQVLKENPDTLTYYKPFREVKARYYEDASLSYAGSVAPVMQVGSGTSNKYLCYLGGDHPVTVLETDADGPVCLLLKESYGNAFAPWLTSHFSKIICIDPREFNRNGKPSLDLVRFAEKMGVEICLILNYPMMLNSDAYVQWLGRMVK